MGFVFVENSSCLMIVFVFVFGVLSGAEVGFGLRGKQACTGDRESGREGRRRGAVLGKGSTQFRQARGKTDDDILLRRACLLARPKRIYFLRAP
jgi:hypothetical protein